VRLVSAVAVPAPLRARAAALPAWVVVTLGLLALTGISIRLRTQAMVTSLWIDEGLSIGIADRPIWEIPGILRLDGAPPLYYMLLSVWMDLRGMGEGDTHALSLGFALLAIPVAFWAADQLWGRRAAWIAALVAALLPYLTYYAQETRMYALVVLLSLVVVTSLTLVFVHGRRRLLPLFVVSLTTAMYTHNWALFLATAAGLTALAITWRTRDWKTLLLAFVPVGLLYAPWLPTLLFQAAHTGAPWSERPDLDKLLSGLGLVLGRATASTAVVFGAGAGIWALLGRRPLDRDARTALSVLALGGGALLIAWVVSQVSPAWANRYYAVAVGPLVLLVAVGFARAGRLGLVALALCTFLWLSNPRDGELRRKSNAMQVGNLFSARVEPGDQVVVTHPEQAAVMHYYLPDGLRWADPLGRVEDPRVFDWRDVHERLEASAPAVIAEPIIRGLAQGQRLLLIQPLIRGQGWGTEYTALVRERVVEWERLLDRDKRLRRVDTAPKFGQRQPGRGLRGVLYVRR
jgi:mannosyltransferase